MTGTNAPGPRRSGRSVTTGLVDPFLEAKLHRPPTREPRVDCT